MKTCVDLLNYFDAGTRFKKYMCVVGLFIIKINLVNYHQ